MSKKQSIHVTASGSKIWTLGTQPHRLDGPAVENTDGSKFWIRRGFLHREDGPAVIRENGDKEWWLNNKRYDPLKWMVKVHELNSK